MKSFPQNSALRRHITRQHQSEPKKCDFCNLKSKRLDHLNAHMRICKNNPTVEDRSENKNNSTMAKKNEIIQATESEPLVKRKSKNNDNFGEVKGKFPNQDITGNFWSFFHQKIIRFLKYIYF